MRLLITGGNKNQCVENFYLNQQLGVVPSHYSLIRCLRDMGHEVVQADYRSVTKESFDEVIVFLSSPKQFVTRYFYDMLEAINDYPNCILAFDDWQMHGILEDLDRCVDDAQLYHKFIVGLNDSDGTPDDRHREAIRVIKSRKNRVLLSVFAGGDMTKLIDWDMDLVFGYNPNPYHRNRKPGDRWDIPISEMNALELSQLPDSREDSVKFEDKQKIFNFASLVQSSTKSWLKKTQKIEKWEVEFFGSRKEGQRRLKESEMVKVYGEQWGCLMPGYKHSGSGWWRARPLQVADQYSILIGDPAEMMLYYKDERLANVTAGEVESMSDADRAELAVDQCHALRHCHPLDKLTQRQELERVLNA